MLRKVLFAKLHRCKVTAALPDYVGSITIDADILRDSGIRPSDAVEIANCRNGERFETYVLWGEPGSGKIEINGAAAHLVEVGDPLIVMHYALMDETEHQRHRPTVLIFPDSHAAWRTTRYEPR